MSEIVFKKCSKCRETKPAEMFSRHKRNRDGLQFQCKACISDYNLKNRKHWRSKAATRSDAYREAERERNRTYHRRNREAIAERRRKYRQNNKELLAERNRVYQEKRRAHDHKYVLVGRLRRRMLQALNEKHLTKNQTTMQALGCDADYFCQHIERQFLKGMNWENRDKWHLDHIVPISSAKTEEEIYQLAHFTNIRPMWATENISKGNQVTHLL